MTTQTACTPSVIQAIELDAAEHLATTLKALADPLRLRILSAIASDPRQEACVCDLSALAQVAQPTVSHHLRVLKDVGVLTSQRRGTWVWYSIAPPSRGAVSTLLDAFGPATLSPQPTEQNRAGYDLPDLDDRVTRLAEELAVEYPRLDRQRVLAVVRESHAGLARTARITRHLMPLTERFARQRLADASRDRSTSEPQVLFVCVANAGRSQLAAALVTELSGGRVVARSAGSAPAAGVHPHVQTLLAEIEGDRAAERFPKPLTDDAVRAADVVVTMGCGDVCPIIEGVRYEDWPVGDPAMASLEGTRAIRDDIATRVQALIDTLLQPTPEESETP